MKKILMGVIALAFLVSCNVRDEETPVSRWTSIATVENPKLSSSFYFRLDNKDLMWIKSTNFPNYIPKDGQRIIANYSMVSVNTENALYNHKVDLYDVYEVLTKSIYPIKPSTQDSIGNDPVGIRQIWIGSDYLNVEFNYLGYNKDHFINLVSDATKTYTDNKIHLEFRHNDNNDDPNYTKWGVVSFKLQPLKLNSTVDSLDLVIHTKEFGSSTDKTYKFTYKFGSLSTQQKVPKILIQKGKESVR